MSWVTIYRADELSFSNIGLGVLADCTRCTVSETLNGEYECEFVYPSSSVYADEIQVGRIVKVKTHMPDDQLFRIISTSSTMTGNKVAKAVHISYDLSSNVLPPRTHTGSATSAISSVMAYSVLDHLFTGESDITTISTIKNDIPQSCRNMLLGVQGSILQIYGGEYEFDNFLIYLHSSRGTDNGLRLRVGYNLQDYVDDSSIDNTYTHIFPYAKYIPAGGTESVICLSDNLIAINNAYDIGINRVKVVDLSEHFQQGTTVTEQQLRDIANTYIARNKPGQLARNIQYTWAPEADISTPVNLGDTVVVYDSNGISATARIVKIRYNSLLERPISIELGKTKQSLTQELKKNLNI